MTGYVWVAGHHRRGPDGKWAWVAPYPALSRREGEVMATGHTPTKGM
jgi:hypothetical protein